MRRICIVLAIAFALSCPAAKLTHYADDSFVVKYPHNSTTNATPLNPPRWLQEDCIPGGSHPSNQTKRLTYDVVCSMAGTADAYLRRNIAASLFGTTEMPGVLLGTNYVKGYEYATTNIIASSLFDRYVLRGYDVFSYTNLDYRSILTTNGLYEAGTRRLIADTYLSKPAHLLKKYDSRFDIDDHFCEWNINDLIFARGSCAAYDCLRSDRWMRYPPNPRNKIGTLGREPYVYSGYGLSIAWGSSFAEQASYHGSVSSSEWVTDPNTLVSDWGCFFPSIANIFAGTNYPYASSDPSYKNLDYSVLDSRPGNIAFQTSVRSPYSECADYDVMRLRSNLHGSFYCDEYGTWGEYKPYPGRTGFELMSDTCGHEVTNFNAVYSKRIAYEPWEQCNAFLGLLDTLYIGQDALPELVYAVTNQTGIVSQAVDVACITINFKYDADSYEWRANSVYEEGYSPGELFTTNVSELAGYTRQNTIGYNLPSATMSVFACQTNNAFTRINRSHDIIFIDSILSGYAEPDEIAYLGIEGIGDTVRTVLILGEENYIREWGNSEDITCKYSANLGFKATCNRTITYLTDYDRTLMSTTNSMPCIHPLNMDNPIDDVEEIRVCYFSGIHSSTDNNEIGSTRGGFYEGLLATNSLYNISSVGLVSPSHVDSYTRSMSGKLQTKIVEKFMSTSGFQIIPEAAAAAFNAWRFTSYLDLFYTNRYYRTFSTQANTTPGGKATVQIRRDSSGNLWCRHVASGQTSWDRFDFDEDIQYLKVYWRFNINGDYSTEILRRKPSCVVKGATTSIAAVKYNFKTMKRED